MVGRFYPGEGLTLPRVDFEETGAIDATGKARAVWRVYIYLPNGEYHVGQAREQSKALLRAVERWHKHEAKAKAKGKANG